MYIIGVCSTQNKHLKKKWFHNHHAAVKMYVTFKMNGKQMFSSKHLLKISLTLSVYCKLRSAKCYEMPDASSF